jgi:site-specific recombinase XerD
VLFEVVLFKRGGRVADEWQLFWVGDGDEVGNSPERLGLDGWADLVAREQRLGLRDRQPILVSPQLRVDARLSEFLRRSRLSVRSPGTQESYVRDYRLLFTFLWRQGRNWDEATAEDLADYEHWRRRDLANPRPVSGAKWQRELAAFRVLYEWAAARGYVPRSPVVVRSVRLPDGSVVHTPELAAADVCASNVKWLTPRAFALWRRVGLLGYGPDDVPDARWRGRNDGRDAAFAEVLFCSGLRRREAGTLLTVELPDTTVPRRFYPGRVAAAVAKHAQRYFYVSVTALQAVAGYRATIRAQAVARARAEGRYDALRVRWMVQHIGRGGVVRWVDTDGAVSEAPLNALTDIDRQRLYVEGEAGVEPLALWLTEAGLPMGYRSWSHVFDRANARCAALGVPVFCTPHMCRHSFALRMLVALHHALDRRLGLSPAERRHYQQVYGDVWSMVKDLLGHRSVETTRNIYLEPVRGLQIETLLGDGEYAPDEELLAQLASSTGLVLDVPAAVVS